jgi:hypothetical protein
MPSFNLKVIVACIALFGGVTAVEAQTKAQPAKQAVAPAKASVLGGKLAFTLPAGYVQGEMPEIDEKAIALGVTGSLYTHQADKRVLLIAEMPIPMGIEAQDNDPEVLDGMLVGQQAHESGSSKAFKKLGEKKFVKKNGLGIGQLDTSSEMSGTKVLSTTIVAASGRRSAIITVISRANNPTEHAAMVKTVVGQ